MPSCARCRADIRAEARFCDSCGAALAAAPPPERRKLATLLFCDMSGSTAMGERVDAESVREMMFSYFDSMRGAIERHGGTVEKFIGDAVVAVFGVPSAREDDALRAVRAAAEMQRRLGDLNEELLARYGSTIALRIGLNTGEVVAGDASSRQTFVTGDAVNVAARLEQAAGKGEVLLGEPTFRLVRHAVTVESVEPIRAKGKSEPVPAYRLLGVDEAAAALERRLEVPLVGRERELALLLGEFGRSREQAGCRLVTVVAEAGVGKSRLAAELLGRIGAEAWVLRGRCLSYGEGITFWPLREIVAEAAGIREEHGVEEARARIRQLLGEDGEVELVEERIAQAVGLSAGAAPAEEIGWAVRRLLERLAQERPLALLVDDIHWAEPALLDLLLDLRSLVEAPVLALCLARPELLDLRPDWPVTAVLDPLGEGEGEQLLTAILGGEPAADLRAGILRAAGGNPLFVEELVAMLVENGDLRRRDGIWQATSGLARLTLPTSLSALLGARLDRLPAAERTAAERAAVEGQVFHRGSVVELSPPAARPTVAPALAHLAERRLLQATDAELAGEAAYRFRHILIRDAAYYAMAKRLRAELHERFADWLERRAGERLQEYEEILGHHLAQAYDYRAELGVIDDRVRALGDRAARRLRAAGRRALDRQDVRAAQGLLTRALHLADGDERDRALLALELARAERLAGDPAAANDWLDGVIRVARQAGDEQLEWRGRVEQVVVGLSADPARWNAAAVERVAAHAIHVFEAAEDDEGLAHAWTLRAQAGQLTLRFGWTAEAAERAAAHAGRAGNELERGESLMIAVMAWSFGPTSASELARRCEGVLAEGIGNLHLQAACRSGLGLARAMQGGFDEGRALASEARAALEALGLTAYAGGEAIFFAAPIELFAGDLPAAEAHLLRGYELLDRAGARGTLSTAAGLLALLLAGTGRDAEAEEYASVCEAEAASDDVLSQVLLRCARALVSASRGAAEQAERLAAQAVALAAGSDDLNLQGDALAAQAAVLRRLGRPGAARALERAAACYELKENAVMAARCREAPG